VFEHATGFAILAALSPTSLLVMAVFLGSDRPRETAFAYVIGALIMTVIMAVAVLFILRGFGLDQPREHDPRYGLRLALGVLALGAAVFMLRRGSSAPLPGDESQQQKGLISRMIARPSPKAAFAVGAILFTPSVTFIAAVQVVATANDGPPVTALGLLIVAAITLLVVWLPLVAFLIFPDATVRVLRKFNGWLRANGRSIVVYGLLIGGIALIINGSLGVASR
jgi:Sap, sulfolipid-1-addressing protein